MHPRTDTRQTCGSSSFLDLTPNTLCELCKSVVDALETTGLDIPPVSSSTLHHQNSSAVKSSADQGCHLCSLFYGALDLSPDEKTLPNVAHALGKHGPLEVEICRTSDSAEELFSLKLLDTSNRQGTVAELSYSVNSESFDVDSQQGHETYNSCADSTASEASFETARGWLARCRSDHQYCQEKIESRRLVPTRIIEIEAVEHTLHLKLIEQFDPCIEYLILSYCWGKPSSEEVLLTESSIEKFSASLSYSTLPKTVKDAIMITHRLGFKYLWVDRLCIIQDDPQDWQTEALRMAGFYLNAVCCIAALSSPSANDGCFVNRNPLMMQPMRVKSPGSSDITIFPHIGGIQGDYPRLYRGPQYALGKRAWTLVERLMSPRTLYYGSLMIYWECRQTRFSETRPRLDLKLPFAQELQKFSMDSSNRDSLWCRPQSEAAMDRFQERWATLVECYTSRQMTFPKDRLMAINGMLLSIGEKISGSFAQGLLMQRITTELLWWQWVDCKEPERTPINAPTWSWASVTGRISPFLARRSLQLDIPKWAIEAEAQVAGSEGQQAIPVEGKRSTCGISFTAPMLKAVCIKRVDLRHYTWWVEADAGLSPHTHLKLRARLWADDPVREGQCVWLVRMAVLESDKGASAQFAGLAIESVTSETTPALWRRVGYWQSVALTLNANPSDAEKEDFRRTIHLTNLRSVVLV